MSMDEMWGIANTISVIVGLLISGILVVNFYLPFVKKKFVAIIIGGTFFITMTVLYLIPFALAGDVAYIIGIILIGAVSILMDRRNISQKIFLSVTVYMLFWVADVVASVPWTLISNATYLSEQDDMRRQFILFIVSLVILVLIENVLLFLEMFIFNKVYIRKSERMELRELPLILSPYIAIIIGYWICSFLSNIYVDAMGVYVWNNYPIYDVVRAVFGVVAFVASVTVVYSYQQIKRAQENAMQNALVSKQVEELKGHVHTIENLYTNIRGVHHDVNNHIMVLGNLIEKGESDEAIEYLNDWQNGFPMPKIDVKTGNPVTDIVISEKRREAWEMGIEFIQDFHYPTSRQIESIDVGVILNNALSNAIRAAMTTDTPKVEVKAWMNNNAYLIQIKNSFTGTLPPDSPIGLPETTKDDAESHGFGLMNMKRITDKYFGTIELEQDDDTVIFTAMMMLPE